MDFQYTESDQTPADREIVPVGVHVMEIRHAEEGPNEYRKCDQNSEGNCLKLRLSCGEYKFVFDDIPQHLGWRAKQLAAAIGTDDDSQVISLDTKNLIGQQLTVEISHYTSKAGKISAVVKRYVPVDGKAKPAKKAEAKKPRMTTAVAMVTEDDDGDVPF